MPRVRPDNVAHSEITDHRIVRRPNPPSSPEHASGELLAWHEPASDLRIRDLGLAYFREGANRQNSPSLLRSYQLLSALPPQQRDPEVLADLASVLLQAGQVSLAVQLFREASNKEPRNARFAYTLGAALEDSGDVPGAIAELERSIALDPSRPDRTYGWRPLWQAASGRTAPGDTTSIFDVHAAKYPVAGGPLMWRGRLPFAVCVPGELGAAPQAQPPNFNEAAII